MAKRSRAQVGRLSRTKGKEFERWVAASLREAIGEPPVESSADVKSSRVKRGEQGHGAVEPDVRVDGLPFWFECQHSARPDPEGKLQQAVSDMRPTWAIAPVPVAAVRRSGARGRRQVQAAMRLGDLVDFAGQCPDAVVTFDWRVLEAIIRVAERHRRERGE